MTHTHTHTHFLIFELKICGTAGATQTTCYLQPQVRTRQHVKIMQTHRKYEHTQFHCDACALRVNKVRDGGLIYIITVPNPEVLQATVNWLHPVCIYGCFALLGLISAVHSRITQYFNAMFRLGWVRARIVLYIPMPDEALDRRNIALDY